MDVVDFVKHGADWPREFEIDASGLPIRLTSKGAVFASYHSEKSFSRCMSARGFRRESGSRWVGKRGVGTVKGQS